MLDKQAIYHKTPQGAEAMANRQSGLRPKLRSLLIMVDGKRSFSDLCALNGDCETLLLQLAQDGLVEPIGGVMLPPAGPVHTVAETQVAVTMPAPLVVATLPDAKRFASRLLMETLGPTSEMLCIKIESAGNLADFVGAVKRARDIVGGVKGAAAADRFVAQVELHTPTV